MTNCKEVDVVKTRLDKIKDALVTEKNEETVALAVGAATSDDPNQPGPEEAVDEAIRCANPAKYAEHGVEYCRHMLPRRSRRTSTSPQSRGPRQVWRS